MPLRKVLLNYYVRSESFDLIGWTLQLFGIVRVPGSQNLSGIFKLQPSRLNLVLHAILRMHRNKSQRSRAWFVNQRVKSGLKW
jgi:hypothetical protein